MKSLLRFAVIFALSRILAPRLNLLFHRLSARVPANSMAAEVLESLSSTYSTTLLRSVGETVGDLVLGPAARGKKRR